MTILHRLKLCFPHYSQTPYWIKIPPETSTIGHLMDLIQRKYGLSERPLLLLQDAVLPEFEELDVLINEEQIVVSGAQDGGGSGSAWVEQVKDDTPSQLLAKVEQQKKLLATTTPTSDQKMSQSQKRRKRRQKLRQVRSADGTKKSKLGTASSSPNNNNTTHDTASSAESSSSSSSDDVSSDDVHTREEKVFLPRGNISSTLRQLEKEQRMASQDKQWNQSYWLQGTKASNEDNTSPQTLSHE